MITVTPAGHRDDQRCADEVVGAGDDAGDRALLAEPAH
jgi:hypothetical protein